MYDCIHFQYICEHVTFLQVMEARVVVLFDLFFQYFLSEVFSREQS